MLPVAAAGAGLTLKKVFSNKFVLIGIALVVLILIIYYTGKKAGKREAEEPSFWDKLFGWDKESEPEDRPGNYDVNLGDSTVWIPRPITDYIYRSYEDYSWWTGGGEAINTAWRVFNSLDDQQKIAVVNDWNQRYFGTDRDGVWTGNYGSLKDTIEIYADELVPQAEIALTWLRNANID